jgi:hypothetical protein
MVLDNLRERIEAHPFFFTLLQMPNAISRMIVKIAISTIGLTGAISVHNENTNKVSLVFIRMVMVLV